MVQRSLGGVAFEVFGLIAVIGLCEGLSSFDVDVTLTSDQKRSLDQFKELMWRRLPHDYMKEDIYLIKWLRARKFDISEAERFLSENLAWREREQMDTIHEEDWSEFLKDYKYWLEGRDKEGKPVLYFEMGTHDIRAKVVTGRVERYARYVNKILDESCGLARTLGEKYHNISRANLIVDMNGFNLVQHGCLRCVPFMLQLLTNYESHFPGCADHVICIRTPSFFEPILNLARPLFSEDTRKSLKIYGINRRQWMKEMSQYFDLNQLPPGIGGSKIYKGMEEDYPNYEVPAQNKM